MDSWNSFILLRHGQTDWNLEGRYQGQADIPLNATGVEQAEDAARRLATQRIDRIVSSPLIRALRTAATVAEHKSLPIHIDSALRERSFGRFDGRVIADVKREHGIPESEPSDNILPDDAEQWPQSLQRISAAVDQWMTAHPNETILFVAHHGIHGVLSETLYGERTKTRHGMPYRFERVGARWTISEVG